MLSSYTYLQFVSTRTKRAKSSTLTFLIYTYTAGIPLFEKFRWKSATNLYIYFLPHRTIGSLFLIEDASKKLVGGWMLASEKKRLSQYKSDKAL